MDKIADQIEKHGAALPSTLTRVLTAFYFSCCVYIGVGVLFVLHSSGVLQGMTFSLLLTDMHSEDLLGHICFLRLIYLFEKQSDKERQSTVTCHFIPICPQQPGLGQRSASGARNSTYVSYGVAVLQACELSSSVFPSARVGSWSETEQLGFKSALQDGLQHPRWITAFIPVPQC